MATVNGQTYTTAKGSCTARTSYYKFYVGWRLISQDHAAKTSTIEVITYWTHSSGYTFDTVGKDRPWSITVAGSTKSGKKRQDYSPWPSNPIASSAQFTVTHAANGTCSVAISARTNGYASSYGPSKSISSSGDCTASITATLPTIIHYTISYNANGGSGTMSSHTTWKGASVKIKDNAFTRVGYTFAGWTTKSDGSADGYGWSTSTNAGWSGTWTYTNGQYGIANNQLVLYARWTINTYNAYIRHYKRNAADTAWTHFASTDKTATYGSTVTPASTTVPTGYYFSHYNTWHEGYGTNLGSSSFTMPATNTITEVYYYPNKYYLDLNGSLDGTNTSGVSPMGTADVYVNGTLVADNVTDWYTQYNYGSTYEVKDIKTNAGYTYTGSASYSGTITGATGVRPSWTTNSYTLTLKPNWGVWNGSNTNQTFTQKYNTSKSLVVPTKTGQSFIAWAEQGSGTIANALRSNGSFDGGSNGVYVYNNSSNGVVSHSIQSATSGNPIGSGYELKISHSGGTSSPGLGGFFDSNTASASKKWVHAFIAKIPVGYTLNIAHNAIGTGSSEYWLTEREGTGEWEEYSYVIQCGSSGSFSTFGHVYLTGPSGAMTWYLAYSNMYDITSGVGAVNYNYLAGNGSVYAMYYPNTYTITYNGNGSTGGSTASSTHKYANAIKDTNTYNATTNEFLQSGHDLAPYVNRKGLGWYYIEFECYTDVAGAVQAYFQNGSGAKHAFYANFATTTSWKKYSAIIWVSDQGSSETKSMLAFYGTYGTGAKPHVRNIVFARADELLTLNGFTKTNYKFIGWNTKADGTGNSYSDGSAVKSLNSGTNLTLYAQWELDICNISYNGNGNIVSNVPATQQKTVGTNIALSSTKPARGDRYKFLGWAESSLATSAAYQPGATFTKDVDTTLYAVWQLLDKDIYLYNTGKIDAVDFKTVSAVTDLFDKNGNVYATQFVTHSESNIYIDKDGKIYAKEFIKY